MIDFYKYQGTGNDFIIIDNRYQNLDFSQSQIKNLCDRRFGIGADGFILLENEEGFDFKMVYYNSDGNQSSMCGNGGRCIARFALDIGIPFINQYNFIAIDGPHLASENTNGMISLKMIDVYNWKNSGVTTEIYTGSPHYVEKVNHLPEYTDFIHKAKSIRYNDTYQKQGINVNLYSTFGNNLKSCTYERGVEDETFSCGTGAVAIILSDFLISESNASEGNFEQTLHTKGGILKVSFHFSKNNGFTNIFLTGPAERVFEGRFDFSKF
jgi:diaminopimelate epimerase